MRARGASPTKHNIHRDLYRTCVERACTHACAPRTRENSHTHTRATHSNTPFTPRTSNNIHSALDRSATTTTRATTTRRRRRHSRHSALVSVTNSCAMQFVVLTRSVRLCAQLAVTIAIRVVRARIDTKKTVSHVIRSTHTRTHTQTLWRSSVLSASHSTSVRLPTRSTEHLLPFKHAHYL